MAKKYHHNQSLARAIKRGNKMVVKSVTSTGGVKVLRVPRKNKAEFLHKNRKERAVEVEKEVLETKPLEPNKEVITAKS